MNKLVKLLKNSALFCDLSQEIIESVLLPQGKILEYSKGSFLLIPQQRLDYFGFVISGLVHAIHISVDGEQRIMDAYETGDIYGTELMCTSSRISPYYITAVKNSQVLLFPISTIMEPGLLSEENRQNILTHLLTIIAHENMRKNYRLAILSQKGLRERIMTYLTMQANKRRTATFTIPFSREDLASFLCVNRSALSNELAKMKHEGLIQYRKSTFTLLYWQETDHQRY